MLRTRILPVPGVFRPLTDVLCPLHSMSGAVWPEPCHGNRTYPVTFSPSQPSNKQLNREDSSVLPTWFIALSSKSLQRAA